MKRCGTRCPLRDSDSQGTQWRRRRRDSVIWFGILAGLLLLMAPSVSLGLSSRHAVSRSVNRAPRRRERACCEGDGGSQGGSVRSERGAFSKNARRYATFIKVKGPEGAHEIEAPNPAFCARASEGAVSSASMEELKKKDAKC